MAFLPFLLTVLTYGEKGQDGEPLIDEEGKENKENMPFGFMQKKKQPVPEVEANNSETVTADDKTPKSAEVTKNGDATIQPPTEDDSSKVKVEKTDGDGKVAVTFTAKPTGEEEVSEVKEQVQSPQTTTKTEKSPLISAESTETPESSDKESKVRDQGPGFLCCAIL